MEELVGIVSAFLGLGAIGIVFVFICSLFVGPIFGILSAVLAKRRGRNPASWFFLGFFYNMLGIVLLLFSKNIDRSKDTDTLAKVLWIIFIVVALIIALAANMSPDL